jgi:hypothetical protein
MSIPRTPQREQSCVGFYEHTVILKDRGLLVMMLGVLFQGPGYTSIDRMCGYTKMKNGDKIEGKSGKNRGRAGGGVLFQGPGCISKYGKYQYAKNENSNKIREKMGDG